MDKLILVTGVSKGIGNAIAKNLSQDGYKIMGTFNQSKAEAEGLKATIPDIELFQVDFSDRSFHPPSHSRGSGWRDVCHRAEPGFRPRRAQRPHHLALRTRAIERHHRRLCQGNQSRRRGAGRSRLPGDRQCPRARTAPCHRTIALGRPDGR